jgi:gliding motility-associated lipoprotein GldH
MNKIGLIFVGCLFIYSCDSNRVFEDNMKVIDQNWSINDVKKFEVDIADTNSQMNVFVNVRHTSSYSFSNLWIFVNMKQPNGEIKIDTLECVLSQPDGKWLGEGGITDLWTKSTYLNTQRFKLKGIHTFEIEQAMRYGDKAKLLNLEGISDLGLRIETTN